MAQLHRTLPFLAASSLVARALLSIGRLALAAGLVALTAVTAAAQTAPDGPGAVSHFGIARKDCLGTARNTTSKVWYTVANGVLSDVYYPTVDNTNVETLQYIVTDGATFTDLQTRDMTYTVKSSDAGGMECVVTATAKSGKYEIVTSYLTDPGANTLLLRVRFKPSVDGLRLFIRFDPSVNGNGGGGSANSGGDSATIDTSTGHLVPVAFDTVTVTNAANRDYAQPVFVALDGSRPFSQATVGFAGVSSDGLVQLDAAMTLTNQFTQATNGNVVVTAEAKLSEEGDGSFTLALGFGSTQAEAAMAAERSLAQGFPSAQASYRDGWKAYDDSLEPPPSKLPGLKKKRVNELGDEYYLSANLVKAAEDKTFPGAIVASLAAPWGQALPANDPNNSFFGSYREVFARDLYQAWTALVVAGDQATARDTVSFLFDRQ